MGTQLVQNKTLTYKSNNVKKQSTYEYRLVQCWVKVNLYVISLKNQYLNYGINNYPKIF